MRLYSYHNQAKKSIKYATIRRLGAFFLLLLLPMQVFAATPTDPYADQWSFAIVKAPAAWEYATGSRDVVVAILDNGFDTFHPDLEPNAWKNDDEVPDNGIDDDRNGYIDDVWGWNFVAVDRNGDGGIDETEDDGNNDPRPVVYELNAEDTVEGSVHHGTLVAGIIGAVGNNGQFGAGINWRVRLMNVKVVGNSGNIAISQLAKAIHYAVDNGAHVINISLIGPQDQGIRDAVRYAYEKGVAVIAAAGNDYASFADTPKDPVCADQGQVEQWVLGVAAIAEDRRHAQFSNIGGCIDISAPGVHVSSTMRYAPAYGLTEFYGGPYSGTSFAAPFVSGAAALVKSIRPDWGAKQIYDILLKNISKTPPKDEGEYARLFGAGLVQVDKAVQAAFETRKYARLVSGLGVYDPGAGRWWQGPGETAPAPLTQSALRGSSAASEYRSDAGAGFVVVAPKGKAASEVKIFDSDWGAVRTFTVPFAGDISLAVGDVAGDAALEIIVAPRSAHTVVFRAYSFEGKEVGSYYAAKQHQGASVAVARGSAKGIVALIAKGSEGVVQRFSGTFAPIGEFNVPFVRRIGNIGSGDIDGDGREDYALSAGVGDESYLAYYRADGTQLRKFNAYDPSYRGGVALAVGDYDGDGSDDAVIAGIGMPVRVWSGRSRKLIEWQAEGFPPRAAPRLLIRYR